MRTIRQPIGFDENNTFRVSIGIDENNTFQYLRCAGICMPNLSIVALIVSEISRSYGQTNMARSTSSYEQTDRRTDGHG